MSLRTARRGREHLVDPEQSERIYLVIRDENGKVFSNCLEAVTTVFQGGAMLRGAERAQQVVKQCPYTVLRVEDT